MPRFARSTGTMRASMPAIQAADLAVIIPTVTVGAYRTQRPGPRGRVRNLRGRQRWLGRLLSPSI
jgi:hypothetical protein